MASHYLHPSWLHEPDFSAFDDDQDEEDDWDDDWDDADVVEEAMTGEPPSKLTLRLDELRLF